MDDVNLFAVQLAMFITFILLLLLYALDIKVDETIQNEFMIFFFLIFITATFFTPHQCHFIEIHLISLVWLETNLYVFKFKKNKIR